MENLPKIQFSFDKICLFLDKDVCILVGLLLFFFLTPLDWSAVAQTQVFSVELQLTCRSILCANAYFSLLLVLLVATTKRCFMTD